MLVSLPWDVTLEFSDFVNFGLGMVTGVILFLATFTYFTFRGKRVDLTDIKRPENEISEAELRNLIESKQKKLKRMLKYEKQGAARSTLDISYELLEEISRYFFPDSKYPMLELSVNELIELNHYVSDRIGTLMDIPILKNAKKMRIISIVGMYEKKRAIEQSRLAKVAKKAKLGKVLKYGSMALNAVNPVYWFRKLVINTSIDVMTRKVCVVIIGVVGEETTKIYSKKLFDEPMELDLVDENMEALLSESDDDDAID